jgi:hypothetical protein
MFTSLRGMHKEYQGMIQMLNSNIRDKADGLVGGDSNDDWIRTLAEQQEICQKVDDITACLKILRN